MCNPFSPSCLYKFIYYPLQVVGWKLVHEEGALKLQGFWKVRDTKCGEELINRIRKAVESTGHLPTLHLEAPNQVRAELWTSSIGKEVVVVNVPWIFLHICIII